MSRLIVENVHKLPSRPWLFVTGRLEGGTLHIGDELVFTRGGEPGRVVVRSIEIHGAPDFTTVAVEGASAESLPPGVVLTTI